MSLPCRGDEPARHDPGGSGGLRGPGPLGGLLVGVLGYRAEPASPGRYQQLLSADGDGVEILLQQVPEAKAGKNRVHLDLRVPDLDAEVTRVVALGARLVTDRPFHEFDWTWHVLADPDGNEFCILQPPA